jgi:hypothetical protein
LVAKAPKRAEKGSKCVPYSPKINENLAKCILQGLCAHPGFCKKKKVEPSAENYVIYHASVNILQSGMICVVIADIHWLLFRKSELL